MRVFLERWLRDYVESNVAPKTRLYYSQVVKEHLIPRFVAPATFARNTVRGDVDDQFPGVLAGL